MKNVFFQRKIDGGLRHGDEDRGGVSRPRHPRSFRVQPPDVGKQGVLSFSFGSTALMDTMTVLSYAKFLWPPPI